MPSSSFSALILLEIAAPFPSAEQTVESCLQLYRSTLADERTASAEDTRSASVSAAAAGAAAGAAGGDGEATDEEGDGGGAAAADSQREALRDDFFQTIQDIAKVLFSLLVTCWRA